MAFSDHQDSNARRMIDDFLNKLSSSGRKIPIQPLIEEVNLLVLEKYEFEHQFISKSWKNMIVKKEMNNYFQDPRVLDKTNNGA